MTSYDLRFEPWIPWRRRDGTTEWGSLTTLLDGYGGDNPVVGLSSSRPDFDGSLLEFLVGMLAVSIRPSDSEHWMSLYESPPSIAEFRSRLESLPRAFDLIAESGARFLQDLNTADFEAQDVVPVERLLIDTPGEQTVKQNKAHFVRPERFDVLGLPAAAMALLTLQTYSPAGGAGHRTSMRGGGPLTTLAEPRRRADGDDQLWKLLWMNVPTDEELRGELAPLAGLSGVQEDDHIFPWIAPTRESVKGEPPVTSADAHPLQAFFGMPRRIRLELGGSGVCAFTGLASERTVVGYRTRPYGVNYEHWRHPLSPHYQAKPGSGWLPVHGQPGGLSWRDWPSLALYQPTSDRQPAAVIRWARERATLLERRELRLFAFGYDMDNMKARGWIAREQPLYPLEEQPATLLGNTVLSIVEAADLIASELSRQIRRAEFGDEKSASGDWSWVRETLFDTTEDDFHRGLQACVSAGADAEARVHFTTGIGNVLRSQALSIFDRRCTLLGGSVKMMQHGVVAREGLRRMLRGYSPLGAKMFRLLGLTPPGGGRTKGNQDQPVNQAVP